MIRRLLAWLRGGGARRGEPASPPRPPAHLPLRLKHGYFRELLAANDRVLEVLSELEARLGGDLAFGLEELRPRIEAATLAAFVMVKDLNLIGHGRYPQLYDALDRIHRRVQAELGTAPTSGAGPLVVPLDEADRDRVAALGGKMANLGAARRHGVRVPDGFVITTAAFDRLLAADGLGEAVRARLALLDEDGARTAEELRARVRAARLPPELVEALERGWRDLERRLGRPPRVAVRSSAADEDGGLASFAGQHRTVLDVDEAGLAAAYLEVVASLFSPGALAYRRGRGLRIEDARMAVGVVEMVEAAAAGVLFTRDPARPGDARTVIEAVPGRGSTLVDGTATPDHFVVDDGPPARVVERRARARSPAAGDAAGPRDPTGPREAALADADLVELARVGRLLEARLGGPQDVEWALDAGGGLAILQARPLVARGARPAPPAALVAGHEVLCEDGEPACPGVAAGVVVHLGEGEAGLDRVPDGAVLVAPHSSPRLARVMRRVAAIVTEVGAATGHMAIVARELGVPTIVGAASAARLPAGAEVTVDATGARVYRGRVAGLLAASSPSPLGASMRGTEAHARLAAIAPHLIPLRLTDPTSPAFAPERCASLHDIARFVHETSYEEMFHLGEGVERAEEAGALRLRARLPLDVYVVDLGGALRSGAGARGEVAVDDLEGAALAAFVAGLLDPGIRWDQPRQISVGGFLSVLGEAMVNPPLERSVVGRWSVAMASDRYLNFSTRAGYHFSTVDAWCGRSTSRNYVQFRFSGGGAAIERRERRAALVCRALEPLGFAVERTADRVVARLHKVPTDAVRAALGSLGRLTICTRQLDMLLDSDAAVDRFVAAFLAGDFGVFA